MRLDDLRAALQGMKGSTEWRRIATETGIHYDTIARIARGAIKQPSVQTVESIERALKPSERPAEAPAASDRRAVKRDTDEQAGDSTVPPTLMRRDGPTGKGGKEHAR